jgi:hypothetical protein
MTRGISAASAYIGIAPSIALSASYHHARQTEEEVDLQAFTQFTGPQVGSSLKYDERSQRW